MSTDKKTVRLRLDRTTDSYVDVPEDAKFVVDLSFEGNTKPLWDTTTNEYRRYKVRILKVWVKQADGTFKLQVWPCDDFPMFHERVDAVNSQTAIDPTDTKDGGIGGR